MKPLSLFEFSAAVREAFSFLTSFGFREIAVPAHRDHDPFQIWFNARDRYVVVAGESYGTIASVTLEHNGCELNEIYLVPPDERPARAGRKRPRTQLEQIREAAQRLQRYGGDFLRGDVSRFISIARPLPPYKKPVD